MSESKSVWVLIEHREGQPEASSLETLGGGRQLADTIGGRVAAVVAGSGDNELAGLLASYGADEVLLLDNPRLAEYVADLYVEVLSELINGENPVAFICAATLAGRDLAPRLAARLGAGLVSECVGLAITQEGLLSGTRLTHGGKISSTIICPASGTQLATVKPGIITAPRPDNTRRAEIKTITPEPHLAESRVVLRGVVKAAPDKISLDESDVIVAGGKGAGTPDNLALLEEMAALLGGVVAGSLGLIDEGLLPRKKLVGQTGTTVAPQLYIACGISGSVYHVLGMKDSDFVIAINKDRGAPIFKVADMSIIGDLTEVIPEITGQLRKLAEKTGTRHGEEGNAGKI